MFDDYMDPEFQEWFHREAFNFMMTHRLDFLNTFYSAYESGFKTIAFAEDSLFSGTAEDFAMFSLIKSMEKPRKKKTQPLPKDWDKQFIDYMNKRIKEDK